MLASIRIKRLYMAPEIYEQLFVLSESAKTTAATIEGFAKYPQFKPANLSHVADSIRKFAPVRSLPDADRSFGREGGCPHDEGMGTCLRLIFQTKCTCLPVGITGRFATSPSLVLESPATSVQSGISSGSGLPHNSFEKLFRKQR